MLRRRELDQHAAARGRAEEDDAPRQPLPRRLVDQRYVLGLEGAEVGVDVRRLEADVVQPFAVLREEARHARVSEIELLEPTRGDTGVARTPWSAMSASRTSGSPKASRQKRLARARLSTTTPT